MMTLLVLKMTNVPNRFHNSGKEPKRRLKPQAVRARLEALKALKRKYKARS